MSALVYDRQDDFSGGMVDAEGNAIPANACEVLLNFETTRAGKVRRRKANAVQGVAPTAVFSPRRGISYIASSGVQWVVFGGSSQAYYTDDDGATWTPMDFTGTPDVLAATTMNIGGSPRLYLTSDASPYLHYWNGSTLTAAAGTPPTNANLIATFNDRLWIVPTGSDQVYASQVAAAGWDTDAGAFTVSVTPDDDDTPITALLPLADELLVFRKRSVSSIRGYGEQSLVVAEGGRGVSSLVGAPFGMTVQAIDGNRAIWLSERGVEMYEGGQVRLLSRRLQRTLEQVSWTAAVATASSDEAIAVYSPVEQVYRLMVPVSESGAIERYFIYAYNVADGSEYIEASYASDDAATGASFALNEDGIFDIEAWPWRGASDSYFQTPNGMFLATPASNEKPYVCMMEFGAPMIRLASSRTATTEPMFSVDEAQGDPVPTEDVRLYAWLRSRPFTFGAPSRRKRVREIRVDVGGTGSGTLTVRPVVDGVAGTAIDIAVSDPGDSRKPRTYKARVTGTGRTIQVDVWTQNDFTINGIEVGAEIFTQGAS